MANLHRGRQSMVFDQHPAILSQSAIGGKMEMAGPLSAYFDYTSSDTTFKQTSWELAERKMQELALNTAKRKLGVHTADLDVVFAGDLLDQCISSSFAVRNTGVPYLGLYGACSTMAEALCLSAMAVNSGYARMAAAVSYSHFASVERQYRFPLGYGGQRTPTAQWTVTGSGCMLLGHREQGPFCNAATIGTIVDYGIKDSCNMGAAMAPAAYHTLRTHFDDLHLSPSDYDLIVTGDLGKVGKSILIDLFSRDGVKLDGIYDDCGTMIYDLKAQDVHAGGSGAGCGTVVLCGYLLRMLAKGTYKNILFCGTGALLSPLSAQQGESIPAVCHAISIGTERR